MDLPPRAAPFTPARRDVTRGRRPAVWPAPPEELYIHNTAATAEIVPQIWLIVGIYNDTRRQCALQKVVRVTAAAAAAANIGEPFFTEYEHVAGKEAVSVERSARNSIHFGNTVVEPRHDALRRQTHGTCRVAGETINEHLHRVVRVQRRARRPANNGSQAAALPPPVLFNTAIVIKNYLLGGVSALCV